MSETLVNKTQAGEGIWTKDNLLAGTNISITQVQKPVIDENTVALFHCDNTVANAIDGSTVELNGYNASFPDSMAMPNFGGCYQRTSGYMFSDGSKNFRPTGDFTIDFWVKWISGSGNMLYIYPGYGFCFGSSGSLNKIYFLQNSSVTSTGVDANYNEWHHIALERYGNVLNYYVNGQKASTYTVTVSQVNIENEVYTGGINTKFDEIRLSNVARYKGQNFTPFDQPYAAAGGPAQYAINNTKADPDLSSYLQNTATGNASLTILGTPQTSYYSKTINIGDGSQVNSDYGIAIGQRAQAAGTQSIAIGTSGSSSSTATTYASVNSIAIGTVARATSTSSIAIGNSATARSSNIAIGNSAKATSDYAIRLGPDYSGVGASGANSIGIGVNTSAEAQYAVAIGNTSHSTAVSAIQLGTGTNNTQNTFQVFEYQLLDANGKIPADRLPTTSSTSLHWFKNNTGTTLDTQLSTLTESSKVFKNGLLLELTTNDSDAEVNDYTISEATITFTDALVASDKICVEC